MSGLASGVQQLSNTRGFSATRPQLVVRSQTCLPSLRAARSVSSPVCCPRNVEHLVLKIRSPCPTIQRGLSSTATPNALATSACSTALGSVPGSASLGKLLAVVLGYAVLVGAWFRGVPQIVKLVKHQSAEGLSFTSYVVELLCYTITVSYNLAKGYAFNTFGEVWALWVQDVILVALMVHLSRMDLRAAACGGIGFVALCAWLFQGGCSAAVLDTLQLTTIATMALGSRLPQIILNLKRGNAGMMSVTTCLLTVAGNIIRLYTTIVLTKDSILLVGVVIQAFLNSVLLYQSWQTLVGRQRFASSAAPVVANNAAFSPQPA